MKSVTQLIDSHQGFSIANFQVGFQATFRQEALHKIDTQLLEPIFMTYLFVFSSSHGHMQFVQLGDCFNGNDNCFSVRYE